MTKETREQLLQRCNTDICELTNQMDQERATLGRVTRKSVKKLAILEELREILRDLV